MEEQRMIHTYTNVTIDREHVFKTMNCYPDSPVYDQVLTAYEELLPQVERLVEAVCLFGEGTLGEADGTVEYPAGTKVIYMISSVGHSLSRLSTELFEEGEYLQGAMSDAMADACLLGLEKQWMEDLREYCRERNLGIRKRLEPPQGLPMSVQKTAWEQLNAKELAGLEITSGYMYNPLKSVCQVFVITEDAGQFRTEHDCRRCPQVNCPHRHVEPVRVTICERKENGDQKDAQMAETITITCDENESILDAYRRQVGYASAVCGGRGTCGKCRIRLLKGELKVTSADRSVLTEEELLAGYRLSCRAYPEDDCSIQVCFQEEEAFEVLSRFAGSGKRDGDEAGDPAGTVKIKKGELCAGIAIDIGTTTLAAQLINLEDGQILASASAVNHQRAYGADVISRLEASNSGQGEALQKVIRADLDALVKRLLQKTGIASELVKKVVIAGNTVMCHLLMGYSCRTLGVYPFTPVNLKMIHSSYSEIVGSDRLAADTWILPGFSTYVGADITAGIYACGMAESQKLRLMVDLGTNGEMAIGNQDRLLTASVAAGPAFEGGNISCGTGSVPGAVSHVRMDSTGSMVIETIQGERPSGICGTGVIELTAELLRMEVVDATGRLEERYEEAGYPFAQTEDGRELCLTQKDIREIQLAKAAVRAGVETLIKRYGVRYEDIEEVLLAGGMGFQLDQEAAVTIGLLPEELKEKITAVGNSSLAGCVRALRDDSWQETTDRLTAKAEEQALATDEYFGAAYIEHMMFPEEEF